MSNFWSQHSQTYVLLVVTHAGNKYDEQGFYSSELVWIVECESVLSGSLSNST